MAHATKKKKKKLHPQQTIGRTKGPIAAIPTMRRAVGGRPKTGRRCHRSIAASLDQTDRNEGCTRTLLRLDRSNVIGNPRAKPLALDWVPVQGGPPLNLVRLRRHRLV